MLRFLYACGVNLLRLLLLPWRLWRRRHSAPESGWLRVDVTGGVVEVASPRSFLQQGSVPLALHELREAVELLGADPHVSGLLVVLQPVHFGSATARSLRDILLRAQAVGKRVACYLPDGGGTLEFFIASAANTLILGREAHLTPSGFAIETPYVKRALHNVGLSAEVYAQGRYKTAAESLVLEGMSQAQTEQLGAILDLAWQELISAVSHGRRVTEAQAEAWIHQGFWTTQAAISAGLADACAYADELLGVLCGSEPAASHDDDAMLDVFAYARRRAPRFMPFRRPPYIAVVEVSGTIVSKAFGPFGAAVESDVHAAFDRAREDRKARGVIVHINSRGGSAAASDRLRHELERVAKVKPVIAYFGDAAASGGYMIGVAARRIVCQPTTLTGSIGVIGARLPLGPLLERLGISQERLKRGAHADLQSPTRPLEPEERALIDDELRVIYDSFVSAVARGRKRDVASIAELAEGRVWSGRAAQERGLIDELGGFDRALTLLRSELGASTTLPVGLLEARKSSMTRLLELVPGHAAFRRTHVDLSWGLANLVERSGCIWAWCPVHVASARVPGRG